MAKYGPVSNTNGPKDVPHTGVPGAGSTPPAQQGTPLDFAPTFPGKAT